MFRTCTPPRSSWLLLGLRGAVCLVWIVLVLGLIVGWLPDPLLALALFGAFTAPLLWPLQFGSWWGLLVVCLAAALPAVVLRFQPLTEATMGLPAVLLMVWQLAAWSMLPLSIVQVCWRSHGSPYITLLGVMVMPIAMIAVTATGLLAPESRDLPLAATFTLLVNLLPLWFVSFACLIGPLFFTGSLAWLLYREAASSQ